VSAHRSAINHSIPPPPSDTYDSDHPFRLLVRPAGRSEAGDYGLSPTLYTYSSLSTVYRKFIDANTDLYRTPYPPSNLEPLLLLHPLSIPPTSFRTPYGDPLPYYELLRTCQDPLRRPPTFLRTTTDLSRPLTETPCPPANHYGPVNRRYGPSQDLSNYYGPVNRFYGPLQDLPHPLQATTTRYVLHYTHSMADLSKQVDEGQKKWRQGVDVTSTSDVNDYINFKILEYGYYELLNDDLWE
jgi:hypothetical protein